MTDRQNVPVPAEQEAIQMVRRGRKDAFRLLVENHWERIHNLLRRFLKDPDLAEDLCQEAFLQAFTSLDTFDETRPFGPWMSRVAVNTALMHRRKTGRQVVVTPYDENEIRQWLPGPGERVVGAMIVDEFLARLPESFRLLFLMRYALDLSYEEMADFLSEPVGTVKSNLYRARELLKQAVGEPESRPQLVAEGATP
jgi:RNA polymerase sigma-70 factor (ECF subfamily)